MGESTFDDKKTIVKGLLVTEKEELRWSGQDKIIRALDGVVRSEERRNEKGYAREKERMLTSSRQQLENKRISEQYHASSMSYMGCDGRT